MSKYLRLVGFLKDLKPDVAGKVLIGLLNASANFFQAFMIAKAVSAVFAMSAIGGILPYLGGILFAIIARALLLRLQESYTKHMAAKVKGSIRGTLLDKLMQMGPAYQNDKRSGNVQSLITDGVESLEAFLVNYIPQTAVVLISVSVVICYICTMDFAVGILILAAAVLSILIPHFFMPSISRVMIEYWQDYAHLNAQYIEAMQGMNTLKAFHASRKTLHRLKQDSDTFARSSIRNTGISLADSALITLFSVVGTSVSVVLAAWHTALGTLPVEGLLIILFLAGECMRPLSELNSYWHASYLGFSVAEQLYAVLDAPILLVQPSQEKQCQLTKNPPGVELQNVTFRYGEDTQPALRDVNLFVAPGETVAIVGKSGSGKSTIVNLLLRFFDVSSGCICIDATDVRDYTLTYLRQQIAVVFQDTYLFYGTVEENLRMAKPTASGDEIIAAAKAANAHGFIEALPEGYKTIVGERGATLSGGERQRIAIARAILKDAPILVLDEATSNVDVASEQMIQDALANLMQNRTTIIIAHRLSTIAATKKIFVLAEGHLCEQGTHIELVKQNGEYANLVRIQQSAGRVG